MRIDVHAHYYPREFVDAYARLGKPGGGANQAPGGKVTLDERVDMLAEAGIDLQILCVGTWVISTPLKTTRPARAGVNPTMERHRVVLPTPFRPTTAATVPRST